MSICSKIGVWRMNRSYSSGVQKPMTFSTPARLYQERSNRTTSPAVGSCADVALVVPLALLALGGCGQGGDAHDAGAEVLRDALDRAALAGCVATLEHHDDPRARLLGPQLHPHQLGLEPGQLRLVDVVRDLVLVLLAGLLRHARTLPAGMGFRPSSASAG